MVHNGDLVSSEAGGPVELAVILVQLPIWAAYRFIMWFTLVQTLAFSLAVLVVGDAVAPQATVLVFTRPWIDAMCHKTCKKKPNRRYNKVGDECGYLSTQTESQSPQHLRGTPSMLDGVLPRWKSVCQTSYAVELPQPKQDIKFVYIMECWGMPSMENRTLYN